MENDWARRATNGETIEVQIEVIYDGNTNRPVEFIVTEIVDGVEQVPRIFKNQPGG